MGTLVFLWAWSAGKCNTPYDAYFLSLLVALEVPAYLNVLRLWWLMKR